MSTFNLQLMDYSTGSFNKWKLSDRHLFSLQAKHFW